VFEVTPWVSTLCIVLYVILSAIAIVTGVCKRTWMIKLVSCFASAHSSHNSCLFCISFCMSLRDTLCAQYVIAVFVVAVVITICCLINVTTYADTLTKFCTDNAVMMAKCDHYRTVALVMLCTIVGTNVVCCVRMNQQQSIRA
jgi:hypothetical protein